MNTLAVLGVRRSWRTNKNNCQKLWDSCQMLSNVPLAPCATGPWTQTRCVTYITQFHLTVSGLRSRARRARDKHLDTWQTAQFPSVWRCRSMSKYVEVCSFEDRMDRYGQGTLRISPEDVRKQTTVLRQIMNAISIFNEKQSCFLFLVSLCFLMFPYVSLHRELNLPNHQIRGEIWSLSRVAKSGTAARMKSARTAAFETLEDEEVRSIEDETDEELRRYESVRCVRFPLLLLLLLLLLHLQLNISASCQIVSPFPVCNSLIILLTSCADQQCHSEGGSRCVLRNTYTITHNMNIVTYDLHAARQKRYLTKKRFNIPAATHTNELHNCNGSFK